MHLRAIHMRGFKSFPDPVEISFEPGVSIVVGPNGSGKSNVADAIVWAAGSLSPSQLRAEKPDDVIYAGSGSREPAEYCEVELCFDNADGTEAIPYSELSIMRRIHRGGEGQYLLNRSPVRRLDVLELLADVGLGGEMHAIISQGRVDAVLASKPAERRALIEEAAGLGAFKQRRRRAELKLKRVRGDVDRARDLEKEVRKRLRPLALQASAAERAEKLRGEIAEHELRLWSGELAALDAEANEIDGRKAAADADRRRADQALEGLLAERSSAEDSLQQAAGRHEQATAALYRLRSALERLDVRGESATELATALRQEHEQMSQLALVPRDDSPLEELEQAEQASRSCAAESRAALEQRERLEQGASLAAERLSTLERSLAEREGLPPAARVLADEGRDLALSTLDVDPGYERSVAAALSWRGSAVLAGGTEDAVALLERSRRDGLGTLGVVMSTPRPTQAVAALPHGATSLAEHARAHDGGGPIEQLLANVSLLPLERLTEISTGMAVTKDGHCFDADRGELWYEGETARTVLMSLETRRRELAHEVSELRTQAEQAAEEASVVFEAERQARKRLNRARLAAVKVPAPVDPAALEQLGALATQSERLVAELAAAAERARDFESPLQARVDAGSATSAELGQTLRQLGEREAVLRRQAGDGQQRLSAIEVESARLDVGRRELRAKLGDDAEAAPIESTERDELTAKLERLQRRLEGIGQVNPLAAEEHGREKERLAEITTQREDLEQSVDELERLCVELAETVEKRFAETFTAVQENFTEVASTLFPGGEGRLRLTEQADDDEDDELGVEVELRPAGKRITRLSLLSGGEKALGALSFLFALFLARPCPFYLLDEVEAALDDANIERFVELLRRYSDRAQFVVVTHQKMTMEAADILYDVTMGPDGVSHMVS
ncbi:MAG: chromosome segregation SMC family protein, partial [Gaiellaceae bacterium]